MDEYSTDQIREDYTDGKRHCEYCQAIHTCQRCRKSVHICLKCKRMSHDCEICGENFNSLSAVRKHQTTSKFCQKARTLVPVSLHQQLQKVGMMTMDFTAILKPQTPPDDTSPLTPKKATRRQSCPTVY